MGSVALGKRRAVAPRSHGLRLSTTVVTPPPTDTFYRITPQIQRITTNVDDRVTTAGDDRVISISYRRVTTDGDPRVWQH